MTGIIIIFLITYVFIATEWVDKAIAAILGAALVICLHFVSYEAALHAVDINVIFLLVGMMIVVNILGKTGLFEWLSIKLAKLSRGNGIFLLVLFLFVTAFLSSILDNVTTVILIAPITILLTQILELPTVPFLILEAIFSNIGGTATLVGDPPNILIGSQTSLNFADFIINLGPVVTTIIVIVLAICCLVFRQVFKVRKEVVSRIERARPEAAIVQPVIMKKALMVFALILIGFFAGHALHIEPGIIALAGGFLMASVCKIDLHEVLEKVEWGTIMFFIGLFMLIGGLEECGVFETVGTKLLELSDGNLLMTVMLVLWASAILSAIVDNIPLVMAMIPLVKGIIPVFATRMALTDPALIEKQVQHPLFWALALGACLGGNGSLIGASANVIVARIAKRNNYELTFFEFTKYGLPIMMVSLLCSSVFLYIRYFL